MGESLLDAEALVPVNGRGHTGLQRSAGPPGEVLVGLGRVEEDRVRVIGVAGPDLDLLVLLDLERPDGGFEKRLDLDV